MSGAEVAAIGVFVPISGALLATLFRLGSVMGRIDATLRDHDRRIEDLESRRSY